jgi:transposase
MHDGQIDVPGSVDTHSEQHVAAVVDVVGKILGVKAFPASTAGYRCLLAWMRSFGQVAQVGVEGTGSCGAGLARYLARQGVVVLEVNRPNRQARRRRGKSGTTDAEAAARAVLNGGASGTPKSGDGPVEAMRALRVARRSAMKARTQAANQISNLIVTAPEGRSVLRQDRPAPDQPGGNREANNALWRIAMVRLTCDQRRPGARQCSAMLVFRVTVTVTCFLGAVGSVLPGYDYSRVSV